MGIHNFNDLPTQLVVPDLVNGMAEDGAQLLQSALGLGSTGRDPLFLHICPIDQRGLRCQAGVEEVRLRLGDSVWIIWVIRCSTGCDAAAKAKVGDRGLGTGGRDGGADSSGLGLGIAPSKANARFEKFLRDALGAHWTERGNKNKTVSIGED